MKPVPRNLRILTSVTIALFVFALYIVLIYAPREAVMGDVQRVFYFHVSAGWVGALAFFVTVIASTLVLTRGGGNVAKLLAGVAASVLGAILVMFLYRMTDSNLWLGGGAIAVVAGLYLAGLAIGVRMRRDWSFWDSVGLSSVEIGVVFTFINIVSGSIWSRPIWNTWWTWDPRLVTATIMLLLYLAYLMLRQGIDDPNRRARFGSIYGIVAFVSVPITFLSIRLFRTIHPVVIGSSDPSAEGAFEMTDRMAQALMFSVLTFTFIYATLLWYRIRLGRLSKQVEERKMELMSV
ncbi:MAG: cytochrome c biogenesis protein CcsA [Anaerolineales bacterium]